MKRFSELTWLKQVGVLAHVVAFSIGYFALPHIEWFSPKNTQTPSPVAAPAQVTAPEPKVYSDPNAWNDSDLVVYITKLMILSKAHPSELRKKVIIKSIIEISRDLGFNWEEAKGFAVLIAIESKFNPNATSPAGAVGLTQVIPKYAQEFASKCGIRDVKPEDLKDVYSSLLVGGCRYKELLESLGNSGLVLVAYNAGLSSQQMSELKSLQSINNKETAGYIAKWLYLKEEASKPTEEKKEVEE
jgi:hypothetical protein